MEHLRRFQFYPLGVLLALLLSAQPLSAKNNDHLQISEVFVHYEETLTTIEIYGQDFDHGPGPLSIKLGDFDPAEFNIETHDQNYIEVTTSLVLYDYPGHYTLTTSMGNGESQTDDFDITIDGVGTPGPSGGGCLGVFANGIFLGYPINSSGEVIYVFNPDVAHILGIGFLNDQFFFRPEVFRAWYPSEDCSGQTYLEDADIERIGLDMKDLSIFHCPITDEQREVFSLLENAPLDQLLVYWFPESDEYFVLESTIPPVDENEIFARKELGVGSCEPIRPVDATFYPITPIGNPFAGQTLQPPIVIRPID